MKKPLTGSPAVDANPSALKPRKHKKMINLNTVNFEETPASWRIDFGKLAEIEHNNGQLKIIIDVNIEWEAGMWVEFTNEEGVVTSAQSEDTKEWPLLDRLFGRKQWQDFLTNYGEEIRKENDIED